MLAIVLGFLELPADIKAKAKPLGGAEWSGAIEAPAKLSSKFAITDDKEKGERLVVTGTIFKPDGKTPAEGVLLYVYQTDVAGVYSRGSGNGNGPRHGKLRGWMLTGADGKYEFSTIKPGSYPNSRNPAHIHLTLTSKDYPEHYIDEYWFQDDPYVPAADMARHRNSGTFNPILTLTKGNDGIWKTRRDMKLQAPSRENGGIG